MSRDKIVGVRLTLEEYEEAQRLATEYGYSMSSLMRYLLQHVCSGVKLLTIKDGEGGGTRDGVCKLAQSEDR